MKIQDTKNYGMPQKQWHLRKKKRWKEQFNFTLQLPGKEEQTKHKVSRRKKIIKIRAEIK